MERENYQHPSFGLVGFSRINGSANFYGSELKQDHYVQMTVKQSEIQRDLSMDRYYAYGTPVIKIRMTSGQFSEMITSMNYGDGVPCTIEGIEGRKIEDLPIQESRKEFVHRKFKDRMSEFAKNLTERQKRAMAIVNKKTLSKEDAKELQHIIECLTTETKSNIPFFMECFQETMDVVVFEAKTEAENAILHKVTTLGMSELHRQNKLLSEGQE
jgi:hypothetical protein